MSGDGVVERDVERKKERKREERGPGTETEATKGKYFPASNSVHGGRLRLPVGVARLLLQYLQVARYTFLLVASGKNRRLR